MVGTGRLLTGVMELVEKGNHLMGCVCVCVCLCVCVCVGGGGGGGGGGRLIVTRNGHGANMLQQTSLVSKKPSTFLLPRDM